jgi:hypothetical protein
MAAERRAGQALGCSYVVLTMSVRVGVSSRVVFSLINCVNEYGVVG